MGLIMGLIGLVACFISSLVLITQWETLSPGSVFFWIGVDCAGIAEALENCLGWEEARKLFAFGVAATLTGVILLLVFGG